MPEAECPAKTILLVEDEALIALAERRTLERYGFRVRTAADGEGAVEAAAARDVDLVLMDINLGTGIDGTEAAKRILAARDLPEGFDPESSPGFGLQLVRMLAEQLNGSFSIRGGPGTTGVVRFRARSARPARKGSVRASSRPPRIPSVFPASGRPTGAGPR